MMSAAAGQSYSEWTSTLRDEVHLPESVGTHLDADELATLSVVAPRPPFAPLENGVRLDDGTIWAGSAHGLMCLRAKAARWRLFHSQRWLPDDRVLELSVANDGAVWVRTAAGAVRFAPRRWTLEEKMETIHQALRKYHLREGFCCEIRLNEPGTLEAGYTQPDNDNDGLWTAIYVAAEAFRFGATGDPQARANAWQSLQTMITLEEITGISGFAARSFVPIEIDKSHDSNWYRSADGRRWWKNDTSSDEVVGHFFAYCIYYAIAATEEQKAKIRPVVARIADHIIDNGFTYVGPSGRPTTWGVWSPEKLNRDARRIPERGLNSLEVLSHMKVAEYITGESRFAEAARQLIDQHGYAANTIAQKIEWPPSEVNHSDDELAFLSYYPLLWLERAPDLRRIYLWSIERSWHYERSERSPLFNYIYATAHQASHWQQPAKRPPAGLVDDLDFDRDASRNWFRRVPCDTLAWRIVNSHRQDLGRRAVNRFERACSDRVLPIDERLMLRWNADPYELDLGDGGRTRGDGAFILLPYWMGRYHRLLD
jgi:hypothetical protein